MSESPLIVITYSKTVLPDYFRNYAPKNENAVEGNNIMLGLGSWNLGRTYNTAKN